MTVDLPFLMHGNDEVSAAGYLFDYFDAPREISQDVFTSDNLGVIRSADSASHNFSIC